MKNIDNYSVEEVLKIIWDVHVGSWDDLYPFYDNDEDDYYSDDFLFDTKEQAVKHAEFVLDTFQGLDDPFMIYRTININKWDDIDYDDLGNHWSFEKQSAINFARKEGGGNILLSGKIYKNDVDWEETLVKFEEFSGNWTDEDEDEIYVPDTSKVFDIKVEQFRGSKINEIIFEEIKKFNENNSYNKNGIIPKHIFMEKMMKIENLKHIEKMFKDAGWSNVQYGDYTINDLDLIDKNKNDLPYPDESYGFDKKDYGDYVDKKTGHTVLPEKMIPMGNSSDTMFRPENKEVYYGGRWFIVYYYHDGSVMSVIPK